MGIYDRSSSRRAVLRAVGGVSVLTLAGCIGNGDDSGPEDDADDDDGNGGRQEWAFVDHPIDEPIEITPDHDCVVCSMTVAEFPEWNGQLAHDSGEGVFFCSSGCFVAYYVVPDHFDAPDATVEATWITEYGTEDLIDGDEAHYVLVRDHDQYPDDPMGLNPRPFADRDDAIAYAEDEELGEDDVVELSEVDQDVAAIYREERLP